MSPAEALALIEPVLSALAAAHRAGLIHRDVKPENVLLADDGRVKVADFGLASAVSADTQHTATGGVLIGTVSYLSPELVVDGRADARADVYAAGVVLYEMLTGRKPHEGESPIQVAYKHVHEDVPPPSRRGARHPGVRRRAGRPRHRPRPRPAPGRRRRAAAPAPPGRARARRRRRRRPRADRRPDPDRCRCRDAGRGRPTVELRRADDADEPDPRRRRPTLAARRATTHDRAHRRATVRRPVTGRRRRPPARRRRARAPAAPPAARRRGPLLLVLAAAARRRRRRWAAGGSAAPATPPPPACIDLTSRRGRGQARGGRADVRGRRARPTPRPSPPGCVLSTDPARRRARPRRTAPSPRCVSLGPERHDVPDAARHDRGRGPGRARTRPTWPSATRP